MTSKAPTPHEDPMENESGAARTLLPKQDDMYIADRVSSNNTNGNHPPALPLVLTFDCFVSILCGSYLSYGFFCLTYHGEINNKKANISSSNGYPEEAAVAISKPIADSIKLSN